MEKTFNRTLNDGMLNFVSIQEKMIIIYIFSQFFFLLSFGSIGGFSLTLPFIVSAIYLVVSFVGFITGNIRIEFKRFIFVIVLLSTIILASTFSKYELNVSSLILYCYYFMIFLFTDYRIKFSNFKKILTGSIILITITSLFGIYQFLAYNVWSFLSLKELIPEALWVSNYNTIQTTFINSSITVKSHSIYAEASLFSQYSALAIIFSFYRMKDDKKLLYLFAITINAIGLLLSLSGTGIIIIIGWLFFTLFVTTPIKRLFIVFLISSLLLIYCFIDNYSVIAYYINRTSEFGGENTSAYYRFILPFRIGIETITDSFLGFGAGNDNIAYELYEASESSISNGFGKIFVESGILGLVEFIYLFVLLLPKCDLKTNPEKYFFWILFILLNIVGTFLSPIVWPFALILSGIIN